MSIPRTTPFTAFTLAWPFKAFTRSHWLVPAVRKLPSKANVPVTWSSPTAVRIASWMSAPSRRTSSASAGPGRLPRRAVRSTVPRNSRPVSWLISSCPSFKASFRRGSTNGYCRNTSPRAARSMSASTMPSAVRSIGSCDQRWLPAAGAPPPCPVDTPPRVDPTGLSGGRNRSTIISFAFRLAWT